MNHQDALQAAGEAEIVALGLTELLVGPGLAEVVVRAYLEARADEGCDCGPHSDNPAVMLLADFENSE